MTYTMEAVETLAAIMRNPKAPLTSRAAAANSLLDRAIGRPEFSGKIETSQVMPEPNLENLTDAEFGELLRFHAEFEPLLNKIFLNKNGGDT